MNLIQIVHAEPDDNKTIPGIVAGIGEHLELIRDHLEDISPAQAARLASTLIDMGLAINDEEKPLVDPIRESLSALIELIMPHLERTSPEQCARLLEVLTSCEFTVATRLAVSRRHAAA